jgi:predicted house-cleaning noncanonical NTP pyrophosphatase (MazG superfamily)
VGKFDRDQIPDLIRASGHRARVKTLSSQSYREALIEKLREEVAELVTEQRSERVLAEAADVLEVLVAIAADHGVTLDTIVDVARRKRMERGGFDMRLWLDGVDPNSHEWFGFITVLVVNSPLRFADSQWHRPSRAV